MRGFSGALVVAVATLLVCCNADPQREQDGIKSYGLSGHKNRVPHPMFEANQQDARSRPAYGENLMKMLGYISRQRDQYRYPLSPLETSFYYSGLNDDYAKRNFDEIDRSNLDTFLAKRNFDEIDRSSLPFPYATKRFFYRRDGDDDNMLVSNVDKKRVLPEFPMDEIDHSEFPIGSKRSFEYHSKNQ